MHDGPGWPRSLGKDAAALQRRPGYRPDRLYPIEVFASHACHSLLGAARTGDWCVGMARTGTVPGNGEGNHHPPTDHARECARPLIGRDHGGRPAQPVRTDPHV